MKTVSLALVLSVIFLFTFEFQTFNLSEANFHSVPLPEPAFTIKSDGSIEPSTAPIRRNGDIYSLTDNVTGYTIIIEQDNIILDGGGYTLRGTGYFRAEQYGLEHLNAGVYLANRRGVTVKNMKISGFNDGIFMLSFLDGVSSNNHFENNLITENYYGIYIEDSRLNMFRNNILRNNTRDLCIIDNVQANPKPSNLYVNDIDTSNTVDGKLIIYWVNKQGLTVPFDAGYVILVNCSNMIVQNLELSHNGQGIVLISTTDSRITKNHIANTDSGVYLYDSSNLVLARNNLDSNDIGIEVWHSSNNNVTSNSITRNEIGVNFVGSSQNSVVGNMIAENNGWGIQLTGSSGNNLICQNNFVENNNHGIQANINTDSNMPASNNWDNGAEGNYWSDYESGGQSAHVSTVGRTPYFIADGNKDNFPLPAPLEFSVLGSLPQEGEDSSEILSIFIVLAIVLIIAVVITTLVYSKKRSRKTRT